MDVAVTLLGSTYSAIQSAISSLYHQSVIERLEGLRCVISMYCKG